MISPNLVSTLRYGFTRAGNETSGALDSNYEWFRRDQQPVRHRHVADANYSGESDRRRYVLESRRAQLPLRRLVPQYFESVGKHRQLVQQRQLESFLAKRFGKRPAPRRLWAVSSGFKQNYEYAMAAALGLEAQGNADYNYR